MKEKENEIKNARADEEGRICDIKYKEINEKMMQIEMLCASKYFPEDDEVLEENSNLYNVDTYLRDLHNV